jgi:DnaT-like ssDNA binding protein
MTLIATAKSPSANSYVTAATASAFIASSLLYATDWPSDQPTQEKALIWATSLLELVLRPFGARRTFEQALAWPRSGVRKDYDTVYYDYDTIPAELEQATAIFAMELCKKDRTAEPELLGLGFRQASLGPMNVTVDPSMVLRWVPDTVINKLRFLGTVEEIRSSGSRVVKLERA